MPANHRRATQRRLAFFEIVREAIVTGKPSYWTVRDDLWERLPESHPFISKLEDTERKAGRSTHGISPYTHISDVLMWSILVPAADAGDVALAERVFAVIEDFLGAGDPALTECVQIRVVARIGQSPALTDMARAYAGRHLREAMRQLTEDDSWLIAAGRQ